MRSNKISRAIPIQSLRRDGLGRRHIAGAVQLQNCTAQFPCKCYSAKRRLASAAYAAGRTALQVKQGVSVAPTLKPVLLDTAKLL